MIRKRSAQFRVIRERPKLHEQTALDLRIDAKSKTGYEGQLSPTCLFAKRYFIQLIALRALCVAAFICAIDVISMYVTRVPRWQLSRIN